MKATSPDDDYLPDPDRGAHPRIAAGGGDPEVLALAEEFGTPDDRRIRRRSSAAPERQATVRTKSGGKSTVAVPLTLEEYREREGGAEPVRSSPASGASPPERRTSGRPLFVKRVTEAAAEEALAAVRRRNEESTGEESADGSLIELDLIEPDEEEWSPHYEGPWEAEDEYTDLYYRFASDDIEERDQPQWKLDHAADIAEDESEEAERRARLETEMVRRQEWDRDHPSWPVVEGTVIWETTRAPDLTLQEQREHEAEQGRRCRWDAEHGYAPILGELRDVARKSDQPQICENPNGHCEGIVKAKGRCGPCLEYLRTPPHRGVERPARLLNRSRRRKGA